jgi:hypothetical protein
MKPVEVWAIVRPDGEISNIYMASHEYVAWQLFGYAKWQIDKYKKQGYRCIRGTFYPTQPEPNVAPQEDGSCSYGAGAGSTPAQHRRTEPLFDSAAPADAAPRSSGGYSPAFIEWATAKFPMFPVWWTDSAWKTWQAALRAQPDRELLKDCYKHLALLSSGAAKRLCQRIEAHLKESKE